MPETTAARGVNLDAIQARAAAATPGPWRWGGLIGGPIYLLSMAQWRPYVMQFCRLGFQGAQPIFRKPNPNLGFSEWAKGNDVAVREVPYRDDIESMDNPDAEFIAHAREDVDAMAAELRLHRAFRDKVRRALGYGDNPIYVMGEVGVSLLELDNKLTGEAA